MCTRQRPGAHEGRAGGRLLGRKERGLAHPGRRPTVAGADASSLVVSSHKTVIGSCRFTTECAQQFVGIIVTNSSDEVSASIFDSQPTCFGRPVVRSS